MRVRALTGGTRGKAEVTSLAPHRGPATPSSRSGVRLRCAAPDPACCGAAFVRLGCARPRPAATARGLAPGGAGSLTPWLSRCGCLGRDDSHASRVASTSCREAQRDRALGGGARRGDRDRGRDLRAPGAPARRARPAREAGRALGRHADPGPQRGRHRARAEEAVPAPRPGPHARVHLLGLPRPASRRS